MCDIFYRDTLAIFFLFQNSETHVRVNFYICSCNEEFKLVL